MITYEFKGVISHVNCWKFPDGGVGVNVNVNDDVPDFGRHEITVTAIFGDQVDQRGKTLDLNDQIMCLMQTFDALKRKYVQASFMLYIPYLPYARQDRVCTVGEGHSLKVFASMLNSLDLTMVVSVDVHSNVAVACINNFQNISANILFESVYTKWDDVHIVAPDQGATKKAEAFAEHVGAAGVITCMKKRSGSFVNIEVLDHVPFHAKLLVLDDICDGGATFINVAKCLEEYEPYELSLAVTHGLFTQGVDKVAHHFDTVYTSNLYIKDREHERLIIVK